MFTISDDELTDITGLKHKILKMEISIDKLNVKIEEKD